MAPSPRRLGFEPSERFGHASQLGLAHQKKVSIGAALSDAQQRDQTQTLCRERTFLMARLTAHLAARCFLRSLRQEQAWRFDEVMELRARAGHVTSASIAGAAFSLACGVTLADTPSTAATGAFASAIWLLACAAVVACRCILAVPREQSEKARFPIQTSFQSLYKPPLYELYSSQEQLASVKSHLRTLSTWLRWGEYMAIGTPAVVVLITCLAECFA